MVLLDLFRDVERLGELLEAARYFSPSVARQVRVRRAVHDVDAAGMGRIPPKPIAARRLACRGHSQEKRDGGEVLIDWNHFANSETPESLLKKLSERGWITRPSVVRMGEFHSKAIAFAREIEKRFYNSYPDSTEEIRALPIAGLSEFEDCELAALVMWAKRYNDQNSDG